MNCIHCKSPNPEQWFYCKSCGHRASESIYTTNLFMQSEVGKRSDIEFSTTNVEDHIKQISANKKKKENEMWSKRIKQASRNG